MFHVRCYLSAILIAASTLAWGQAPKPTTTPASGTGTQQRTTTPTTTPTPRPSATPATPPAPQVITVNVPTPEATPPEDLKAEEGDVTVEVNFTPFGGTPISISYIRGRYFLSDNLALRVGLTFSLQNQSIPSNSQASGTTPAISYTGGGSVVTWGILPGIEYHFEGTRRLSPFIGAQLDLLVRNSGYTLTTSPSGGNATTYTSVGGVPTDLTNPSTSSVDNTKTNYFNPGLSALVGCDFYFSKHIYMGTEFGLGFSVQTTGNVTVTNTTTSATTATTINGAASFGIAPVYNSAIRVGFVF